jgi:hypothetical protein
MAMQIRTMSFKLMGFQPLNFENSTTFRCSRLENTMHETRFFLPSFLSE